MYVIICEFNFFVFHFSTIFLPEKRKNNYDVDDDNDNDVKNIEC